jgi:hypothetical protein
MDDPLGSGLVKKLAKGGELRPSHIEFLGCDRRMQLLNAGLQSTLGGAVSSATLERLTKPLLGTLDIWHVNNSSIQLVSAPLKQRFDWIGLNSGCNDAEPSRPCPVLIIRWQVSMP